MGVVAGPSSSASGDGTARWKWKPSWIRVLIATIFIAAMLVLMYPSTAAWFSSYEQSRAIRANASVVQEDVAAGNAARVEEVGRHNEALSAGGITVGADQNKPTVDGGDEAEGLVYQDILDGTDGMMARIKIDKIGVDLPVDHGTSGDVLAKSAGHLKGSL